MHNHPAHPSHHHGEAQSFAELPLPARLQENLRQAKFTSPMPIQARALPPALEGKDILGTAQTGSGKTLAFALPILERLLREKGQGIEALVLVPTRELAMQVEDTFRQMGRGTGLHTALVVGGLPEGRQLETIRRGAGIVIATPGRLEDYLRRRLVSLEHVKALVLDEADRMVDMGFLPQMRAIMRHVPRERQTMCFSATLGGDVAHLVHDYLRHPVRVQVDAPTKAASSVTLRVCEVMKSDKFALLVHLLETEPGTFLVFTRTKRGATNLFRKLQRRGFDAAELHGDKSQAQRTKALEGFKGGRHRVLVATDIAARGIHVERIAHVVNFDLPQEPETFIHRSGRTGRVQETGTATTFVTPEQIPEMRAIEKLLGTKMERMPTPPHIAAPPPAVEKPPAAPVRRRRRLGSRRPVPQRPAE